MSLSPRTVGLVALLALLPVAAFVVINEEWLAAVSLVNVLIIAGSIAIAMSPHEGGDHATTNGA